MKPHFLISCVFFVVVMSLLSSVMPSTTQDNSVRSLEALTEGSNKFAISLYQALRKEHDDNIIVSPLSIQLVLTLAYLGARGETAKEIKTALSLPESQEDILNGHKFLINELNSPLLKLATKMFIEGSLNLKDDFVALSTNYFLSSVDKLDFIRDSEKSRVTINQWVEDKTNNKIKDLLQPGIITSDTRLVLVNAVHFKANWKVKFDVEDTMDEPFYITPTETVKVPMMHKRDEFGYKHNANLGAKFLEMVYEGGDFKMLIILPDEKDGLSRVESQLQSLNLVEEFSQLRREKVNVALPRFKLEKTMDLNDILKTMGMKTMFEGGANFSGISDEPLVVSQVIQKAFIEVNEEGTEAAAATAVLCLTRSLKIPPRIQEFTADHPFLLFILKITVTEPILFMGTYNPTGLSVN